MRPLALLTRTLVFVHRWLGVALALLFFLWFASGVVMMYRTFPSVSPADRRARATTLTPELIRVPVDAAYAGLGRELPPSQVRLTSFDGRPAYVFGGGRGGGTMVFADDGSVRAGADLALADRSAASWAGRPIGDARRDAVEETDQWTVAGQLRNLRPLYKYSFTDGQQVYVDGTTGEVVQHTTTASRFWAWTGAIPHWMYFTALRVHQPQWFGFVVWSSAIGTVTALLGVIVALWMLSPRRRYRHRGMPTSIPYAGWKRWHTIAGLAFGVITVTWAFSGLLSMGPFPFYETLTAWVVAPDAPAPAVDLGEALRGGRRLPLTAYAERPPAAALATLPGFAVKELEFTQFDGRPAYLVTNAAGETRIVPVRGEPLRAWPESEVMRIVRAASGRHLASLDVLERYDAYYLDRTREAPLPVVRVRMNDAAGTRVYVDPKTGRVVGGYSSQDWVGRWLYHGLHSLDFPWLYNHRPLWDVVVITLMLGGTTVCATSLVLAWQVIARTLTKAVRRAGGARLADGAGL